MSITIKRRQMVKWLAATPLSSAFFITACSDGSAGTDVAGKPSGESRWVSGSTDLITAEFPGDEIFTTSTTCDVKAIKALTKGPCYFQDTTGEDISEGVPGLPMQVALQVIDAQCRPLSDCLVQLWHCDPRGIYSADTAHSKDARGFRTGFCTNDDVAARSSTWCRGQLRTNGSGRVNFKTCFPGWYPRRTIHFHVAIRDPADNRLLTTQLCFADQLAEEICTGHEHYRQRGVQDTPLASGRDVAFPAAAYEPFVMTTRRNPDGTLLAYHRIKIV